LGEKSFRSSSGEGSGGKEKREAAKGQERRGRVGGNTKKKLSTFGSIRGRQLGERIGENTGKDLARKEKAKIFGEHDTTRNFNRSGRRQGRKSKKGRTVKKRGSKRH